MDRQGGRCRKMINLMMIEKVIFNLQRVKALCRIKPFVILTYKTAWLALGTYGDKLGLNYGPVFVHRLDLALAMCGCEKTHSSS